MHMIEVSDTVILRSVVRQTHGVKTLLSNPGPVLKII